MLTGGEGAFPLRRDLANGAQDRSPSGTTQANNFPLSFPLAPQRQELSKGQQTLRRGVKDLLTERIRRHGDIARMLDAVDQPKHPSP